MTIITISEISETLAVTYGYYGLAISAVLSRCQDSEISEIEAVRDLTHLPEDAMNT